MNILLINASPKFKESASGALLNDFKIFLDGHNITEIGIHTKQFEDFSVFDNQDALVLAFPLYVDTVPSHILDVLVRLEKYLKEKKLNIKVCVICNSGFYEAIQNQNALEILKIWCKKSGQTWCRGIGVGAGGMMSFLADTPATKGPKKPISNAFKIAANDLINNTSGDNLYVVPKFPRFMYIRAAHMGWRQGAKQNGLKVKDIERQK